MAGSVLPELTPGPAAAPAGRRVAAQARFDATVMLRNGEQLLLTLILPALLMFALAKVSFPNLGTLPHGKRIDVVAPGVLALAVMSAAFTGQAISTGFDRRNGVLRMLATTPLGRGGLLAGRVVAVLVVEAIQLIVLGALGFALGWRPEPLGLLLALLFVLTGTAAFVAIGLLLAGTMRSEAVLAGANLLWVLLLAGGGVVTPTAQLSNQSGVWGSVARLLPSGALGDGMRAATMHGQLDAAALAILVAWTAIAGALVARFFRWD